MITLSAADQKVFKNWYLDRIILHIGDIVGPPLWPNDIKLADILATYGVDRPYAMAAIRCAARRLGKYMAMVDRETGYLVDDEMDLEINEITMLPVFSLKVTVEKPEVSKEKLLEINIVCDFVKELDICLEEDAGFDVTSIELAAGLDIPQHKATRTSLTVKNFKSSYPNEELGTPAIGLQMTAKFTFPEEAWIIKLDWL